MTGDNLSMSRQGDSISKRNNHHTIYTLEQRMFGMFTNVKFDAIWNLMIQCRFSTEAAGVMQCTSRIQTSPCFWSSFSKSSFAMASGYLSETTNDKCSAWPINLSTSVSADTLHIRIWGVKSSVLGIQIAGRVSKVCFILFQMLEGSYFPRKYEEIWPAGKEILWINRLVYS